MKRTIALSLLLMLALAACSAAQSPASSLDREALMPDSRVGELAGAPMRLAFDRRDENQGIVTWAWEEDGSLPKLLVIEFRFPPADCDGLYKEAQAQSEGIDAGQGLRACNDGRATHLRVGCYYIRVVMLGFPDEKGTVTELLKDLEGTLTATE